METLKKRGGIMSFMPDLQEQRIIQDRRRAFLAFLFPFLILFLAYAVQGVFPVGQRHILTVDLYHQYAPFMAMYRDKILTLGSPFYSFSVGLGVNFFALFAYYLASPLNLLLLLFPPSFLAEAVLLITLLKIGFAGLAFFLFLRTAYRRRGYLALAFSTFYALSGFTAAYAWNVMWLDTIILLPVVIASLIRLFRDGRWILFPVSLALLIATNYYTAYMACLFIALYTPILFFRYTESQPRRFALAALGKLAALTVLAVALTAVLIYPTWESLKLTSASGDTFPKQLQLDGQPLRYLGQLFPFLEPTVRSGAPNLYCGVPVLFLLPLYFVSGRIRMREKIMNGLLLLLLFLSFDFNVLNFIWHGMHYPNQLPHRFSFVAVFLLVTLAYDALRSVREFRRAEIGLLGFCLLLVVPVVTGIVDDIKAPKWVAWATMLFVMIYTLCFSSFRSRLARRRLLSAVLFAFMMVEIVFSTISGITWLDVNEYFGSRDGYAAGAVPSSIREAVEKINQQEGDGSLFRRVEIKPHKSSNDPALYGFSGFSLFASTVPQDAISFFKNAGYKNNGINSYQYRGSTLFYDALFDIRYVISTEKTKIKETERPVVLGNNLVTVYENPYTFPLAFVCDSGILDFNSVYGNPFRTQNDLGEAIAGEKGSLFSALDAVIKEGEDDLSFVYSSNALFHFSRGSESRTTTYKISWIAEKQAPHYLSVDLRGHDADLVEVEVNGDTFTIDSKKKGITEIGSLEPGAAVSLTIRLASSAKSQGEIELHCGALDVARLRRMADAARRNGIDCSYFSDHGFAGSFTAEKDGVLFMSIPYDPGWTAEVDGAPAVIERVDKALMAIRVGEGRHALTMTFRPVGFYTGLYVTLGAFAILLLLLLVTFIMYILKKRNGEKAAGKKRKNPDNRSDNADSTEEESFFQELMTVRRVRPADGEGRVPGGNTDGGGENPDRSVPGEDVPAVPVHEETSSRQ